MMNISLTSLIEFVQSLFVTYTTRPSCPSSVDVQLFIGHSGYRPKRDHSEVICIAFPAGLIINL